MYNIKTLVIAFLIFMSAQAYSVAEIPCQGEILKNVASLFPSGATEVNLGRTAAKWESRNCNSITGCTDWEDRGGGLAGVRYTGIAKLKLDTRNRKILMEIIGKVRNQATTLFWCTVNQGLIQCRAKNYLGADGFITVSGSIHKNGCYYVSGIDQYEDNPNSYREYQVLINGNVE